MNCFDIEVLRAELRNEFLNAPPLSAIFSRPGLFNLSVRKKDDVLAEANEVAEAAARPVPCSICHGDVKQYPRVGLMMLELGLEAPVTGYRVCERCYSALLDADPDSHFVVAAVSWEPRSHDGYCGVPRNCWDLLEK